MLKNEEFIQEFVSEALAHIDDAETRLLKMNTSCINDNDIHSIFRAVHSIKGTAVFFGLNNIVDLAHNIESIFGEIRNGKLRISNGIADIILSALDCLRLMLRDVLNSENIDASEYRRRLATILEGDLPERPQEPAKNDLKKEYKPTVQREVGDAVKGLIPEILAQEPNRIKADNVIEAVTQGAENAAQGKIETLRMEDNIRVNVSILNDLLNLASELVLGRNQLLRSMEGHKKSIPGIEPILQNIDYITTELQEKIMHTRMKPIANIFNRFPRLIRDLSKKLGKEIELIIEGAEVELDKSIIEALADPLAHLVRNAANHGIEVPKMREEHGKPRKGVIELKAYHKSGYVNIDVSDDGAGIDVEKVRRKALEKGIVSPENIEDMSEYDIIQLIFRPGFSTAESVTDISGRGVGMDVVKTNIEKLGGSIEIYTMPEKGYIVRLVIPLTLAIISSLIVEAGEQRFAIPQVKLQEMVRIRRDDSSRRVEYLHNAEVLRLRDKLLPLVYLSSVLGLEGKDVCAKKLSTSDIARILVLKTGSKRFGLIVDKIHDSEEILVKPVPVWIKDCICYSGVTILGDGKTAMILDPEGVIEKANLKFNDEGEQDAEVKASDSTEDFDKPQGILVFKCSGSEVFAIDIKMVARVEKIASNEIETIGLMEYIKFRGSTLKVIRPENYIPGSRRSNDRSHLYAIIPRNAEHGAGILAEEIIDTAYASMEISDDDMKTGGLLRTAILQNRIVIAIDACKLQGNADQVYHTDGSGAKDPVLYTVLLVEDMPSLAKIEKSALENAGCRVLTAENGKEALEILQNNEVEVVVSDIQMPIMDGIELVRHIRSDDRLKHLPVIAVTSMIGEEDRRQGFEAGFDYYEAKTDMKELTAKVKMVLKGRDWDGM